MVKRKEFRHHPDGWIFINDIRLSLEDFIIKNPEYELPEEYTGREYVQGEFHRLYNGKNEQFLEKKWKDGDNYIKDYSKYKELKEEVEIEKELERREKFLVEQLDILKKAKDSGKEVITELQLSRFTADSDGEEVTEEEQKEEYKKLWKSEKLEKYPKEKLEKLEKKIEDKFKAEQK